MKKIFATLFVAALLSLAALPAWAADNAGTVTLEARGNQAKVALALPQEADQSATALRLTFQVEGGDATAEFLFDQGLTSSVQEYRYEETSGRLTVYLAGEEPLFQNGSLELGSIRLKAQKGASATVRVVEDSLELVNAAYGKGETTSASGGEVTLTVESSSGSQPGQTGGSNSQTGSGSSQAGSQSQSSAAAGTVTAQPTAVPQTGTVSQGSGSSTATAAPAPTGQPTQEPQTGESADAPEEPQPSPSPEEDQAAPEERSGISPLLFVGAALAAAILVGGAVFWFRGTSGSHGKGGRP